MTTVEVVCYKYTPLKNGEFPLKVRICKDRKSRYISLGVSVKPQHWDFKRNEPNEKCPNKEIVEKLIANKICEVKSEIVKLKASDTEFTVISLLHHLEREEKIMSVADVFQQHINFLQDMKRTGYMLSVKQTFNSLVRYCGSLGIPFSDIGVGWLGKYISIYNRYSDSKSLNDSAKIISSDTFSKLFLAMSVNVRSGSVLFREMSARMVSRKLKICL